MTSRRVCWAAALAFAAAVPIVSRAQASAAAPWNLFSVRYDTRTSDFIYAAYGYGRTFAMVGALQNPRTGYTELLGALGRCFAVGDGPTQFLAAGAARAGGLWYGQLYYLPTIHRGPLWVRATTEWYVPFSRDAALQFAVSPVSATVPVTRAIEVGVGADVATSHGEKSSVALGPELRFALPNAVLGVDAQRSLTAGAPRLRIFFITSF